MLCSITVNATSANAIEETNVNVTTPFAVISDAYISKKTVTKNETLSYRFTISFVDSFDYASEEFEDGSFQSDAYNVKVYWESPKKQEIVRSYKWPGKQTSITIADTIPVKKGMQAGEWKIAHIYITNGTSENDALSIHHGSEEEQVKNGSFGYHFADMSFSSFNVTGVSKKADNKAPTIVKKSLKVSKTKVKKNKKSTFSVQVKDASGIESVTCIWDLKGSGECLKKMKYNKKTKKYECKIKMTKTVSKAKLLCITVKDIYGNTAYYSLSNPTYKKKYKKAYSKVTIYRK